MQELASANSLFMETSIYYIIQINNISEILNKYTTGHNDMLHRAWMIQGSFPASALALTTYG